MEGFRLLLRATAEVPGEPIIVLPDINVIDGSLSVTNDDACVNPGDDGRPGRSAATAPRVGVIPVLPGSRWDTASAGVRRFHKSSGSSSKFIGPRPRVCQTVQAILAERRWRNTNQQSSKGSGIRQILLARLHRPALFRASGSSVSLVCQTSLFDRLQMMLLQMKRLTVEGSSCSDLIS